MKKIPLLILSFSFVQISFSQNIGVNTTGVAADVSAMLDILSSSKGLLIPRVALVSSSDAATIATPATSLLVYNNGTGGLSPAGYYYNSGTSGSPVWVQLLNGGAPGTAWLLSGNSGTTAGTNFLGTTDAKDVVIKANNTEGFRLYSGGVMAALGIGAGVTPSTSSAVASFVLKGTTSNFNINLQDGGGRTSLLWNATGTGGNYLVSAEVAARLTIVPSSTYGAFAFYGAPTGTAGNAISWIQTGYIGHGDAVWFSPRGTNSDFYIPNASGYVGIGTTSPSYKLQVDQTGDVPFLFLNTTSATNRRVRLQFGQTGTPNWEIGIDAAVSNTDNLYFFNRLTSTFGPVILNNGNVGLGNTNPGAKLEVTGQVKITGGTPGLGKVLTSDAAGLATWSNGASAANSGNMVLLYNSDAVATPCSTGTFYGTTTNIAAYTVVGTFTKVKVEADIVNDCNGSAVGIHGWQFDILYNGVVKRSEIEKAEQNNWIAGQMTYMGAIANGQVVSMQVTNIGTPGRWYVQNFRVYGIY